MSASEVPGLLSKTTFEASYTIAKATRSGLARGQLVVADETREVCVPSLTDCRLGKFPGSTHLRRVCCWYADSVIPGRYLSRSVLPVHRPSARLYILAQSTLARPGFGDDIAFEGSHQLGNSTEAVAVISPRTGL
jgi:hypothetical protein